MKVLILQPGVRGFDRVLARALSAVGLDPLFAYTDSDAGVLDLVEAGVSARFIPLRSRFDVRGLLALRKLVVGTAPAVVYCGTALQCFMAVLAGVKRMGAALVFYRGALRRVNMLSPSDLLIFGGRRVDVYHCNCRAIAESLRRDGVDEARLVVFPGTGYIEVELTGADSLEATARFPKRAQFRLGLVGKYRKVKGFEVALGALSELVVGGTDAELLVVGEGPDGRFARIVATSPVRGRVVLAGVVKPPYALMKSCDCIVVPSFSEGLSKVVVEALGCGVPVVASGVGGIPDAVEHGVSGLLVPAGDSKQLADAVRTLLADRRLALRLVEAGRRTFRQKFNADVVAARYADMFRVAAARAGHAAENTPHTVASTW